MGEIHPCVVSEGSHKQGGAWKDKEGVKPGRKVLRSAEAIRMPYPVQELGLLRRTRQETRQLL